jgi:hypothetical protein
MEKVHIIIDGNGAPVGVSACPAVATEYAKWYGACQIQEFSLLTETDINDLPRDQDEEEKE